jgi:8-oxo-dGTP pyrophosphatase MutT (NUDIX family)
MSPYRPDLVDVWIFRFAAPAAPGEAAPGEAGDSLQVLLLRRSPGRILPGLWQCVSGSLQDGETVPAGALRELREETGIGPARIAAFYDLDQVNQFYEPSYGAIVSSAVFAVRVAGGAEPRLSHEHDDGRWVTPAQAVELAIWPAYRESIRRIVENLVDSERAVWFELTLDGKRARE